MVSLSIKRDDDGNLGDWELGRINYVPTKEEMLILEEFPFNEVAALKDPTKIIFGIKMLITVIETKGESKELSSNKNLVRFIIEQYIDQGVLSNNDAFAHLAIENLPPHVRAKYGC